MAGDSGLARSIAVCATFLVFPALSVLAAWRDGTFFLLEQNGGRGLFEHYGSWAQFVCAPITLILADRLLHDVVVLLEAAPRLCDGLTADHPVLSALNRLLTRQNIEHKAVLWLMSVIGLLSLVINAQYTIQPDAHYGQDVWDAFSHRWGYVAGRLFLAVEWVVVFPLVGYVALAAFFSVIRVAQLMVRFEPLRIAPFDPDGCGGYRSFGRCMSSCVYLTLPFFVIVSALLLTHSRLYPTLILACLAMTGAMFAILFLPILPLHRLLARWKRNRLQELSDELHSAANDAVDERFIANLAPHLRIVAVNTLIQRVDAMSTWPYSITDRSRWASMLFPLLIAAGISWLSSP